VLAWNKEHDSKYISFSLFLLVLIISISTHLFIRKIFRFKYLFLSETYEPVARGTFLKSWIFSIEAWIQMTFFFKSFFFFAYKFWNLVTFSGSSHYSDSPFLRPPIITTAHFSDNPLFRQPITPTMTNIYINVVIFLKSGPGEKWAVGIMTWPRKSDQVSKLISKKKNDLKKKVIWIHASILKIQLFKNVPLATGSYVSDKKR
jgi:hypothetical protein